MPSRRLFDISNQVAVAPFRRGGGRPCANSLSKSPNLGGWGRRARRPQGPKVRVGGSRTRAGPSHPADEGRQTPKYWTSPHGHLRGFSLGIVLGTQQFWILNRKIVFGPRAQNEWPPPRRLAARTYAAAARSLAEGVDSKTRKTPSAGGILDGAGNKLRPNPLAVALRVKSRVLGSVPTSPRTKTPRRRLSRPAAGSLGTARPCRGSGGHPCFVGGPLTPPRASRGGSGRPRR